MILGNIILSCDEIEVKDFPSIAIKFQKWLIVYWISWDSMEKSINSLIQSNIYFWWIKNNDNKIPSLIFKKRDVNFEIENDQWLSERIANWLSWIFIIFVINSFMICWESLQNFRWNY